MDHSGPEGKGPRSGRGLGRCRNKKEEASESPKYELGKGMGLKRKAGGGKGGGKRLKSFDNTKTQKP
jgi:hypothetical protein